MKYIANRLGKWLHWWPWHVGKMWTWSTNTVSVLPVDGPQVSRSAFYQWPYSESSTLLSIRDVPRSAAFWSNSTATFDPAFFKFFSRRFVTVPRAPTTIRITLVSTFHNLFSSLAKSWCLSIFSCSFSPTLASAGTVMSITSALLLSLSITTMSVHLCSVTWSVWIFMSQRIFTLSVSMTGSAVCWYHCSERFMWYVSRDSSGHLRRLCRDSSCTPVVPIYYIRLLCVWLSLLCSCTSCTLLPAHLSSSW